MSREDFIGLSIGTISELSGCCRTSIRAVCLRFEVRKISKIDTFNELLKLAEYDQEIFRRTLEKVLEYLVREEGLGGWRFLPG